MSPSCAGRSKTKVSRDPKYLLIRERRNKMKSVRLRKYGKFYATYDDDALVVHGIFKYKICNGRVGFPESALGKVTNVLADKK